MRKITQGKNTKKSVNLRFTSLALFHTFASYILNKVKMRIMIVDDSATFRDAIRHLLSKNPAHQVVAEAENGKTAIEMSEKHNPDLILMDIEMPIMDGIEATKILLEKNSGLKIIAITAYQERMYLDDILNTGFLGFIYKNNIFDQLENAIESAISGKLFITL
jgi:DNA-binding NarL/FixJ family response regulator